MLVIDPDECIDCALCEPECPVEAIKEEGDAEADNPGLLELNAELAQLWPVIRERKDALERADEWADVSDKLQYLER